MTESMKMRTKEVNWILVKAAKPVEKALYRMTKEERESPILIRIQNKKL